MTRHLSTLVILLAWSLTAVAEEPVLFGSVVDEAGRAVAGASVSGTLGGKSFEVVADAAGSFRAPLPSSGRAWGSIRASAADGRLGVVAVSQMEGKREPVKVVLKPARELAVTIVDREGKPVAGAEVAFLDRMHSVGEGRTDPEGRWLGRVPADATSWSVVARKGGVGFDYATGERARGSKDQPIPLPATLKLTLDGASPVRVKLVDREGKPLKGANVGPWLIAKPGHEADMNLGGLLTRLPVTDDQGRTTIDWMPEQPKRQRSILAHRDRYYHPNNATWLPADKPVDEVTITLLPEERISGRVTHPDGSPAPGASVAIEGQGNGEDGFRGSARTDADGRYAVQAHSEQAYLIAANLGELAAPYRSDVVLRAGKPADGVDLVLGRATKVLGRVTIGKDDKPATGISVSLVVDKGHPPADLYQAGGRFSGSGTVTMRSWVTSDESGRFEFTAGPGDQGRFTLANLVPGQDYSLDLPMGEDGSSRTVTEATASGPGTFSLGDVEVDTRPFQPYVPPTVQQRTAEAFEARKASPPRERLEATIAEAKREYTRPLHADRHLEHARQEGQGRLEQRRFPLLGQGGRPLRRDAQADRAPDDGGGHRRGKGRPDEEVGGNQAET